MSKKLLAITFSALIISACGSSDSTPATNTGNGGTTTGGTTTGGTEGGTSGPVITGQAGNFGDSAARDNAIEGVYAVCPAGTESFSIFAQVGSDWCVPGCPAVNEDIDGDGFGTFLGGENGTDRFSCLVTPNAPGSNVEIFFAAPIDGCPAPAGCPAGSFPPVFISATAGDNLVGTYNCADWEFDVDTQDWGSALTTPAPFSLTLNADTTANIAGTDTSWSFSNGVLTLEGNRTFNNVAVGDGSFTEYFSNVYITRCQ